MARSISIGWKEDKRVAYPNPRGELVCCSTCGRDTRNKSQICARCTGGGERFRPAVVDASDESIHLKNSHLDRAKGVYVG